MKPEESGSCATCRHEGLRRGHIPSVGTFLRNGTCRCLGGEREGDEITPEDTCPDYHKREEPT